MSVSGSVRCEVYSRLVESGDWDEVSRLMNEFMDLSRMAVALSEPPSTWQLIDVTYHFLWDYDYWNLSKLS